MDELLSTLNKFKISKNENEFEDDLDNVINKFNNQTFHDPNYEWETLCLNFSKLKYLETLISEFHIPESEKFLIALQKFMEKIDDVNKRYLFEIYWDEHQNDYEDAKEIKKLLDLSLLEKDSIVKMKYCLNAYKRFITIAEEYRNETFKHKLEPSFTNEFKFKRKKY